MPSSLQDAEAALQETLLAACASLRTWLYRIATDACVRFVERRPRRVTPSADGEATPEPGAR